MRISQTPIYFSTENKVLLLLFVCCCWVNSACVTSNNKRSSVLNGSRTHEKRESLTWILEINGGKNCVEEATMLLTADLISDVTLTASLSDNFSLI